MAIQRISIYYEPKLYMELFARVFQTLGSIEVVEASSIDLSSAPARQAPPRPQVDIVVLPLDGCGRPAEEYLPEPKPDAKLVAFSPTGELGYRRYPGESEWEELKPFSFTQLVLEVIGGPLRPQKS